MVSQRRSMQDLYDEPDLLEKADRLQTLNEISRVVSSTLDLRMLYDTIYQQIGRVMDTTQFFIALHRPERNVIEVPYLQEEGTLFTNEEVPFGKGISSLVIQSGKSVLFDDDKEYDRYARLNGLPALLVGDKDSASGIFVPLNTGNRTIGAMTVQSPVPHAYTSDDEQTLTVIAAQAAVAIENARLYAESQRSVLQMETLVQVAQTILGTLDLQTVLDSILQGMRQVVPFHFAAILLPHYTERCLNITGTVGPLNEQIRSELLIPFGEGITGKVFETGQVLSVPDVREYPGYIDHGIVEIRSEIALPLKRGRSVIGVLDVEREAVAGFSTEDINLLSLFASQAAIAIENARLFTEQQRRVTELAAIQKIVQKLTPLHDVPAVASMINQELNQLIDYHSCRLFLLDQEHYVLIPIAFPGSTQHEMRIKIGNGFAGWIAQYGRSDIISNTLTDPRVTYIPDTPRRVESVIGAPLIYEGRVRGVISLSKLGAGQFDENALRLLEIIAAQVAIAFDRARLYDELRTEAVTDELTHLYNRRHLLSRYAEERSRAVRNRHTLVSMMLDIDKFKRVNDTFGHDAGDVVLRELATVIRKVVRAEDIVARWGGEEFSILLPEIPIEDAEFVADRLRESVREHRLPNVAGVSSISISVGMAMLEPDDDEGAIFTRADRAMYEVKHAGGNGVCVSENGVFRFYRAPESNSSTA